MYNLLGKISIFGSESAIRQVAVAAPIENAQLKKVGSSRPKPDVDSWCFGTPWYRFRLESFDDELLNFVLSHEDLGEALINVNGVEYAICTVCPVDQGEDELLACIFSVETLCACSRLGLSLEISPASVMPDLPYWQRCPDKNHK